MAATRQVRGKTWASRAVLDGSDESATIAAKAVPSVVRFQLTSAGSAAGIRDRVVGVLFAD